MSRSIALATTLLVALLAAAAAPAAEAPTRDEYVNRLEAICKPDVLATQRAMKGARADVQAERLSVAAKKFAKGTAIFSGTVKAIAVEARPPDDGAKLAKWFVLLNRQADYLRQITAQLRQKHLVKAQRLTARFIHSGNLANNVVLPFGFDYCSFKFSRFG
ncbi:MAG TPA: hypothetical protein VFJ61_08000 [Solirubrobacterales bacterium]|nr:hypothetical protein [Solirubrobacterales bacterium]